MPNINRRRFLNYYFPIIISIILVLAGGFAYLTLRQSQTAAADYVQKDQNTGVTSGLNHMGEFPNNQYLGGAFTAGSTYTLTKVITRMVRFGSPTFTITATIYTDNSNNPGTVIGTGSTAVAASTIGTSESDVPFVNINASITNGTKYWVVLKTNTTQDTSNAVEWADFPASASDQVTSSADGLTWAQADSFAKAKLTTFSGTPPTHEKIRGGGANFATPAFVQSAIGGSFTTGSIAATLTTAATTGNLIAGMVCWGSAVETLSSVTDNASGGSNSYTTGVDSSANNGWTCSSFYGKNIQHAPTIVTAAFSGSGNLFRTIAIHEISGADLTSPLDGHKINFQSTPGHTTDSVTSTSFTPGSNTDYIFGSTYDTNGQVDNVNPGTGFTGRLTGNGTLRTEDKLLRTAASLSTTFTDTTSAGFPQTITFGMAFKPASVTTSSVKFRGGSSVSSTIASAGTISDATNNSVQRKIFFDGTNWWAFYMKSGSPNTLFYAYSTDLLNWTESSLALHSTVTNNGGTLSAYFDSGTGTVLVTYYSSFQAHMYMRGNVTPSAHTISSWTANTVFYAVNTATAGFTSSMTIDSNNLVWSMLSGTGGGNPAVATSTHAISTSFADTNTDWSVNTANGIYNDVLKQASLLRLNGSGNMLQIVDDLIAGNPGVKARTWTNSWSTYTTVYSGANASRTNWGSVRVADSNTYVLGQSNTSAWTFSQTTNGTSWNSKTAPSFPTGGLATNSGVALSTDGTFVWACVIRGDANTTVSCNKYTPGSDTWGGWSDVTNTAATRAYVTTPSNLGNGGLPAMWTQTNGGNFEIHIATFVNTGVQFR